MKKKLFLIGIILLMISVVAGCDDDDGPTPPSSPEATSLVVGRVLTRPYIDFLASVYPVYGQELAIDSAVIADSACDIIKNYYSPIFGSPYIWSIDYFNRADSLRFHSGDPLEVTFFVNNVPLTTTLSVLSWDDDIPVFVDPANDDTVGVAEDFTLTWQKIDGADWYGVETYYYFDGNILGPDYSTSYYFSTDTTLTIPGSAHEADGAYWIRVIAVSGPTPESGVHNVEGQGLTGDIYSTSDISDPLDLTVGQGLPDFDAADVPISSTEIDINAFVYKATQSVEMK